MKVSIVVPVYNAGTLVETCAASLLAQTLPPGELEIVFVDDGSSDDSLARLREVEAATDHVRVLTIPNSGWPGRPRNVGTDAASGEYVMYVDQDDQLEPEAMARMHALGSANGADVVLGKVISDFRGVHHYLYRETLPRCTVFDSRIMGSQTPHKMLRRAFLAEHRIRFAEGRRRLEDQLFITTAYFEAQSVAVLADYICYRYLERPDQGNAGTQRVEPTGYYANLREVLDVVDSHTEPGETRDRFYRRFLKTEMLGRLSGRKLREAPRWRQQELLTEIRELLTERFPPSVDAGAPSTVRIRAALTRSGDLNGLVALADRLRELTLEPRIDQVEPTGAGGLRWSVTAELHHRGAPLRLEHAGDDWLLPEDLVGEADPAARRVDPLGELVGDLVVRHRRSHDEWFLPESLAPRIEPDGRLRWHGRAALDVAAAAGGAPLRRGVHDVLARVDAFGLTRTVRVPATAGLPELVGRAGTAALVYGSEAGFLSVRAGLAGEKLRDLLADRITVTQVDDRLQVAMAGAWRGTPRRLVLDAGGREPVTVSLSREGDRWATPAGVLRQVAAGRHSVEVTLGGLRTPVRLDAPVELTRPTGRPGRWARRVAGRVRRRLGR